ncbi:MAG: hypothetical protein LBS18_03275 [Clostridiales bacterium]|nr:hypothetical protein [Clostridiales bacterium]
MEFMGSAHNWGVFRSSDGEKAQAAFPKAKAAVRVMRLKLIILLLAAALIIAAVSFISS